MSLYDILACPNCKVAVVREDAALLCTRCQQRYPIIHNVPVMFPDGSVPVIEHEAELLTRTTYNPWVYRVILQSLLDDQVVLEVGSGTMTLDDPAIVRMDVTLTPYVDIVADVHALPFLPDTFGFIFSQAVVEHLRQPFVAAQAMYAALKDGGYIYHECNFVFAYHGYPHHYFNASLQGLEQIFARYVPLRKGVAPYQMPSFALDMVIRTYLRETQAHHYPHGRRLVKQLRQVVDQDLMSYDIYFTEGATLNVAAGTYFCGRKQTTTEASIVPAVIKTVWAQHPELQARYPNLNDLSTTENILLWAKTEGRKAFPEIDRCLQTLVPFNKRRPGAVWDRSALKSLPLIEPKFGAVGYDPDQPLTALSRQAQANARPSRPPLFRRALMFLRQHGWKVFLREAFNHLTGRGP